VKKHILAENMRRFGTKNLSNELNEISAKELAMGLSLTLASIGGYFGLNYINHSIQRNLEQNNAVDIIVDHPGIFTGKTIYTIHVDENQPKAINIDTSSNVITINTTDIGNMELKRIIRNKLKDIDPELVSRSLKNHHFDVQPNNEY
jgi:predicted nuclease of predicted toxin-antitoxin system